MPVPTLITDLSVTAISNSPQGTDTAKGSIDDYFRAHASIIARIPVNLALPTGADGIGSIQTGTGSVLRPVQDRLRDGSISLADKGATTAALDNSAALLAALTDGRSVYVPDGIWKVTSATALPLDGSYIWGPGQLYRTTSGPIFTANGKNDLTILGVGLRGDQNSWAIQFKNCQKVRIINNRCQDIMLVETDSATSAYGTTDTTNMCRDVTVYGNIGQCDIAPNAVSQQFIRILYTRDFSVCMNTARGYRDLVLAWGGDYSTSGAAANTRKCYTGLIEGNRGTVLAAGIWTGMASDILVSNNKLTGTNFAEGLDAEGSTNITFDGNDAFGFADGITVFGLNRNIRFLNNNIDATANAFRNASSTFYADYGLLEFTGNTFKSATAACIPWVTSSVERMRVVNNRFENVEITLTDAAVAEVIFKGNELYYDYAPAALWGVRFGSLLNGYTKQPKKSQMIIKDNLVAWRGAGISSKRAFGLASSTIAHSYDIQGNNFVGFDEQLSYEGSAGAMNVLVKRNTFDTAATYPSVLHGSSAGMTVIWQDNDRSDGLDAYGTNTPASSFFSDASRIWTNTPSNGTTPGWIRRAGAWGPMAVIG